MKSLSKRERMLLLVLGIAVIGYLYYSFLLVPVQRKIEASKSNIDNYIKQINDTKALGDLVEKQKIELEMVKTRFEEAKAILPQMELNPEIVYNIKKFFEGSGVEVSSITVGQPQDFVLVMEPEASQNTTDSNANNNTSSNAAVPASTNTSGSGETPAPEQEKIFAIPVNITLSADKYDEVMRFVTMFENDRRFVEIESITITANRPAPQAPVNSSQVQTAQGTTKKVEPGKIEVKVVAEGEELKEEEKEEDEDQAQPIQWNYIPPAPQVTAVSGVNAQPQKPQIQVSIASKYYYVYTGSGEMPSYSFKGGVYERKDVFKKQ